MFKCFSYVWLRLFSRRRGVYYINGPDVLPAPLEGEAESEAIARLPDEEARSLLIEHNLRLVVYIARRFEQPGTGIEDLISIGTVGLIKAINTFRADKNIKLATYASRCIENEILMYMRKRSNARGEVSIDEPLNVDWDGNELLLCDVLGSDEESVDAELARSEGCRTLRAAVQNLPPRERRIIQMRFGFDGYEEMTQKDVADLLGISQSYISRLEKRIIAQLRREIAGKI